MSSEARWAPQCPPRPFMFFWPCSLPRSPKNTRQGSSLAPGKCGKNLPVMENALWLIWTASSWVAHPCTCPSCRSYSPGRSSLISELVLPFTVKIGSKGCVLRGNRNLSLDPPKGFLPILGILSSMLGYQFPGSSWTSCPHPRERQPVKSRVSM